MAPEKLHKWNNGGIVRLFARLRNRDATIRRLLEENKVLREKMAALAELKLITPTNAELLKWAAEIPPPAEWIEGDEEELF